MKLGGFAKTRAPILAQGPDAPYNTPAASVMAAISSVGLVQVASEAKCVVELVSRSPERTQALGKTLGENALPGDVFLLVGGLGSGKTCLTQGVLWGLGSDEFARSPTFVLVSQYEGRHTLYHMDLYRLETFEEIVDLGLDEMLFGDGVSVVEWADKGAGAFPDAHLLIRMEYVDEETRRISLRPFGSRYEELVQAIKPALAGWQET